MKVVLTPKTQRAKNRIKEHGNIMTLIRLANRDGKNSLLVESLEETWSLKPGVRQHWMGWFDFSEVEWREV